MHDDSFKPTDRSEEEPTPLRSGAEAWEAFQNNPTDANYTRFYDLTSGLVYTICFRLLREDEEEARDAFQSVYLTLVEGVRGATTRIPKEEIETEIRRLARRHADTRRKRISRRGRREVSIEEIDVPESNCRSVREDLFHREVGELISTALDTFPETVRLAIVLHYYHGMTHQEIAEVLGVSRSKVTKIILKATERLKTRLRKAGIHDSRFAVLLLPRAAEWLHPPASLTAESVLEGMATSYVPLAGGGTLGSGGASSSLFSGGLPAKKLALAAIVLLGLVGLFIAGRARIAPPGAPPPAAEAGQANAETADMAPPSEPLGDAPVTPSDENTSSTADSAIAAGELLGRVVSLYTREPLDGVTIQLRKGIRQTGYAGEPPRTITTDSRGEFHLEAGESGYYEVQALPVAPWQPATRETYVRRDIGNRMPDIELHRLGAIRGRVVHLPEGEGISGLRIQLVNALDRNWPETTTDAQGRFEFAGLTWIHYDLWIVERNYCAVRVDITRGETHEVELPFGSAVLHGRVYREGQPYGFAEVRIFPEGSDLDASQVCSTQLDGTYRLEGLAPGRYRVETTSQDGALKRQVAVGWVDLAEEDGGGENDMILPSGVLGGWVTDEHDAPASGALVVIRDCTGDSPAALALSPVREVRTQADGTFTADGLPPGEYWVTAMNPPEQRSSPMRARVPESGHSSPVRHVLGPGSGSGGEVISMVFDAQTGRSIPNAWCFLVSPDGPCEHRGVRGDDGVLRIAPLPAGEYEVEVGAYGYSSHVHRVKIAAEKPCVLRDTLHAAGAFRWTFKTVEGYPEAGIECQLKPRDNFIHGNDRRGATGRDGCWVVRGLYPGDYIATAWLPQGEMSEVVTIRARDITARRFFTAVK